MSRYKLFVGHLSPDARTRDLERFFKDHGFSKSITEVVVKTGYGFVIFDDRRDADDAIYELNGKELLNTRLQVEYAKPAGSRNDERVGGGGYGGRGGTSRSRGRDDRGGDGYSSKYGRPYNTEYRLLIENLSTRCSWQDIKDYFRQAGEVTFAKCHREKMGEGVVEFATHKDLQNAVRKLNDTELFGKRVKLTVLNDAGSRSRSPPPRRRSRSLSRSPGRRVSRSPVRRSFSRSPRRSFSRSRSRSPR